MTNELTTDEIKELAEACGLKLVEVNGIKGARSIKTGKVLRVGSWPDPINNDGDSHKVLMELYKICKYKNLSIKIDVDYRDCKFSLDGKSYTGPMFIDDEFNNHSIARALLAVLKIK